MLDGKIAQMKGEIIASVQAAVRIRSVQEPAKDGMPFGEGVHRALGHCDALARSLGFRTRVIDNMVGYAEYGEGKEMVAVLGHLDVVPEGEGWTWPPYGAEIHGGRLYGRGALDNKGPTVGALYALKAIADLDLKLKRRVRVIYGLNEETGSQCMERYVQSGEDLPACGFTPDAEYPIINGEKGLVTTEHRLRFTQEGELRLLSLEGGIAVNVVPAFARAEISAPQPRLAAVRALLTEAAITPKGV